MLIFAVRLIVEENGQMLFLRQTKRNGGRYTLIGGNVEEHEFAREALSREALEEAGFLAVDAKPTVPAQAAVLLKVKAGLLPIKDTDVQRLVAGSVPGLNPASVSVVMTAAPESNLPNGGLVALGPLRVSPGARAIILAVVAGSLALVALLAVLLVVTARRLAALERDTPRLQG